jgi:hypothetical protein
VGVLGRSVALAFTRATHGTPEMAPRLANTIPKSASL